MLIAAAGAALATLATPPNGLRASYYTNLTRTGAPAQTTIDAAPSTDTLAAGAGRTWATFSAEWTGAIVIHRAGTYTFSTISDDGSRLEIDGQMVVRNDGVHGAQEASGAIALERGIHAIRVEYEQAGGGYALDVRFARGDEPAATIPPALLLPDAAGYWSYRVRSWVPAVTAILAVFVWIAASRVAQRRFAAAPSRARWAVLDRPLPAIALIVAVAGGIRVLMLLGTGGILWPDSDIFLGTAEQILNREWLNHDPFRTLAYPYLLAPFLAWSREPIAGTWILVTQHALGIVSSIAVYLAGREVFAPKVALAGALLFGVHSIELFYEASVLTESLFVTGVCVALLPLIRFVTKPTVGSALAAGAIVAALTLIRPVAEWYVLAILPAMWLSTTTLRQKVLLSAIAVVMCLFLLQPWKMVNERQFGFSGVALGRGLGFFTRVFDIDRLPPSSRSAGSAARTAFDQASPDQARTMVMWNALYATRRFSAAQIDREMFAFAADAIRDHPVAFLRSTITQWWVQLSGSHGGVRICASPLGDYPCSGRTEGYSRPPFPNRPEPEQQPYRSWVVAYLRDAAIPMRAVTLLAALGALVALARGGRPRAIGVFMVGTVAYYTLAAALTQFPQDRYRLPVDSLLLVLAAAGAAEILRAFVRGDDDYRSRSST